MYAHAFEICFINNVAVSQTCRQNIPGTDLPNCAAMCSFAVESCDREPPPVADGYFRCVCLPLISCQTMEQTTGGPGVLSPPQ